MSSILEPHRDFLSDHWDTFRQLTEVGRIVEGDKVFVHINHIVSIDRLRYHVNRRFDSLPEEYKFNCNLHTRKCRVLAETMAFLMYIVFNQDSLEEQGQESEEEDTSEAKEKEDVPMATEMAEQEEDINLQDEGLQVAALDLVQLRTETLRAAQPVEDFDVQSGNYVVPMLPGVLIGGKDYVFLHDIECMFNLREDYAISLIAQASRLDKEVGIEDDHSLLALETTFDPTEALTICFKG